MNLPEPCFFGFKISAVDKDLTVKTITVYEDGSIEVDK